MTMLTYIVISTKMSSCHADFFWFNDLEELELCINEGTWFMADILC